MSSTTTERAMLAVAFNVVPRAHSSLIDCTWSAHTVVLITGAYCGAYTVVRTAVLRSHSVSWIALWCLEHTAYCDDERSEATTSTSTTTTTATTATRTAITTATTTTTTTNTTAMYATCMYVCMYYDYYDY